MWELCGDLSRLFYNFSNMGKDNEQFIGKGTPTSENDEGLVWLEKICEAGFE